MGLASTVVKEISEEIETKTREFFEFVLPPVDIHKTDSEFVVVIDVPGFPKESIDVYLDGNVLLVRAKKGDCSRDEDGGSDRIVSAQRPCMIDKKIRLPADALDLAEAVGSARCVDGVLTVTVPRKTRGQSIPVE